MSVFPTKILVATDGSREAQLAARTATELANSTNSEVHVVYVGRIYLAAADDEPLRSQYEELEHGWQRVLDKQVRKLEGGGATVARAHLRMGPREEEEIVALAEEIGAGLIVMGSRGLGGIRRVLMGGVSDSVVRHAHCPVLVVREPSREG